MGQKRAKTIPFLVFLTQIAIGIAPANLHLESAHGPMAWCVVPANLHLESVHGAMGMVHCACKSSSRIGSWGDGHGALRLLPPVLLTLPPWRLALLEGGVVSAASYPVQACDNKKLGRRSWSFLFQTDHWPMAWCVVPANLHLESVHGRWSWCVAPVTACTPHTTALAVGPFRGQGCERSELPCPDM